MVQRFVFFFLVMCSLPLRAMISFESDSNCPVCIENIKDIKAAKARVYLSSCCSKDRKGYLISSPHFLCANCYTALNMSSKQCPLCRNNIFCAQMLSPSEYAVSAPKTSEPEKKQPSSDNNSVFKSFTQTVQNKKIARIVAPIIGVATFAAWRAALSTYWQLNDFESMILDKQKRLLGIEFDLFNTTSEEVMLDKELIIRICSTVSDEMLRKRLINGLISYEKVLRTVYQTIVETYYYRPVCDFQLHEQELINQLGVQSQGLLAVLSECKSASKPGVGTIGFLFSGVAVSLVLGYYSRYASYKKKWGVL